MAEENTHMDDAFKRLGEEFKTNYKPEFWEEAKAKLDDAMLDDAFKSAAAAAVVSPSFEPTEGVDDMFMDSAFVDAASEQSVNYDASYFEQFLANEGDIAMDEAFVEAAGAQVANYLPEYWNDADKALQNEGLHYEYHSEYWEEAKRLLDKHDRRTFFFKWSAVATILLLIAFTGNILSPSTINVDGMAANEANFESEDYQSNHIANINIEPIRESLMADKEFTNSTDIHENNFHDADFNNEFVNNDQNLSHNDNLLNDHLNDNESSTEFVLNNSDLNSDSDVDVNTDVNSFESLNINTGIAEENRPNDNLTLMNIGRHAKTPINLLGYARPVPEPLIKIKKQEPMITHKLGVLAEGGFGNRWGNFSYMPTMRTGVGIEYMASFGNPGIQNFEFGGNFKINHIRQSQLNAEERSDVYDVHGNVTKYWRKLQLKDMVFANLNGLVNYRVAPDHKLKFGVGVEYLTAVRSNMSYVDDFTTEITTVNNNWGVKDGIKKFDLRFSIGYEYEISNRFSMQINSNFGVFDRTDNDFLKDVNKDSEMNIMLGLKYNFMKLKK